MQAKTRGIVINRIKYSDSADIVSFYTRDFGRASYMVYRSKSKKSVNKTALLQPLSILEMEVKHSPKRDIHRIVELRPAISFVDIPFNPVKNSMTLFITEVINNVMQHSDKDEVIFYFLEDCICKLDSCDTGVANFHLVFLVDFLKQLGLNPNLENAHNGRYFDLINADFVCDQPPHASYLQRNDAELFLHVLQTDFSTLATLKLDRTARIKALNLLLEYFKVQLPDFRSLHSVEVLHDLWN